jgi:hypothetical protein
VFRIGHGSTEHALDFVGIHQRQIARLGPAFPLEEVSTRSAGSRGRARVAEVELEDIELGWRIACGKLLAIPSVLAAVLLRVIVLVFDPLPRPDELRCILVHGQSIAGDVPSLFPLLCVLGDPILFVEDDLRGIPHDADLQLLGSIRGTMSRLRSSPLPRDRRCAVCALGGGLRSGSGIGTPVVFVVDALHSAGRTLHGPASDGLVPLLSFAG